MMAKKGRHARPWHALTAAKACGDDGEEGAACAAMACRAGPFGRRAPMSVELNHLIIPAGDKWASARFLAEILGLEAGPQWGHFVPVRTANGVTLHFADAADFRPQHYAFLVGEAEFDAALARLRAMGVRHYANFRRER